MIDTYSKGLKIPSRFLRWQVIWVGDITELIQWNLKNMYMPYFIDFQMHIFIYLCSGCRLWYTACHNLTGTFIFLLMLYLFTDEYMEYDSSMKTATPSLIMWQTLKSEEDSILYLHYCAYTQSEYVTVDTLTHFTRRPLNFCHFSSEKWKQFLFLKIKYLFCPLSRTAAHWQEVQCAMDKVCDWDKVLTVTEAPLSPLQWGFPTQLTGGL